jgi:hypothetical protein
MVACTVKNPAIAINGRKIILPVEMRSGSYLEFSEDNDCVLYGPKGEEIKKVTLDGDVPMLLAGDNQIRFSCDRAEKPAPRVKLTVISMGKPL